MFSKGLKGMAAAMVLATSAGAEVLGMENVTVSGAYLAAGYAIDQKNEQPTDASRDRFDAAANIDIGWKLSDKIRGIVQFELGVGNSSVGLTGGVNPGDIHAIVTPWPEVPFAVTAGSFDIPFGAERFHATGHADATANSFHFNSLMGSAFGSRQVSWPGTVGVMADYSRGPFTLRGALTNGTSGDANNADGHPLYAAELIWRGWNERLWLSGGYLKSDDRDIAGNTGLNADLSGWVADARFDRDQNTHIAGSYGQMKWGDDVAATRDDVTFWMAEGAWGLGNWSVAGRYSVWEPDDNSGDGAGMSSVFPNPGFAVAAGGVTANVDQDVSRVQVGGRWRFAPNTYFKAEWFRDEYKRNRRFDADGIIVSLNGVF